MSAYTNALQGLLKVSSMLNRPSSERVASSAHELRKKIAQNLRANSERSKQERAEDFLSFVKFPVHNIIVCLLSGIDIYNDLSNPQFNVIKTLSDTKLAKLLLTRKVTTPDDKEMCAADFLFVGTDFSEKDATEKTQILKKFFGKTRLAISNLSYIYAVLQTNDLKTVNGMPVEEVVPQILLSLITGVDPQKEEEEEEDLSDFHFVRGQFKKKRKKNLFTRYLTKAKGLYNKSLRNKTRKDKHSRRATELLLNFSFLPHRLTDMVKGLVGEFGAARGGVDTSVIDYENILTEDMAIASFEINEDLGLEASRTDEMKALYTEIIANKNFDELSDEDKKTYVETVFNLINYRDLSDRALATLRENLHLIDAGRSVKDKMLRLVLDKQFIRGTLSPEDESMIGLDAYDEREIRAERSSMLQEIRSNTLKGNYLKALVGVEYKLKQFGDANYPLYEKYLRSGGANPVPAVLTSKEAKAHALLYFENSDRVRPKAVPAETYALLYQFIASLRTSDHPLAWRPRSSYKRKNRDLTIKDVDLSTYALKARAVEDPRIKRTLDLISENVRSIDKLEGRKNKVREMVTAVLDTSEYISSTLKTFALSKTVSATDRARSQSYVPSHKVEERRAKRFLTKDKTQLLDQIKAVFLRTSSTNTEDASVDMESNELSFSDFKAVLTADYFGDFSEIKPLIEDQVNTILKDGGTSSSEKSRAIRDLYSDVVSEKRGESKEAKEYDANLRKLIGELNKLTAETPPPKEGEVYTEGQRKVAFLNSFISALSSCHFSRAERLIPLLPQLENVVDYKSLISGGVGKALNNFEVVLRRRQRAEIAEYSEKIERQREEKLAELNQEIEALEEGSPEREAKEYEYAVIESRSEDDEFSKKLRAFKRTQRAEMRVALQEAEERGETKTLATYNKYVDRATDKIEETIVEVLSNLALASANENRPVIQSLNKTLALKSKIGDGAFESILKESGVSSNMNLTVLDQLKEMIYLNRELFEAKVGFEKLLIALNLARTAHTGYINAADDKTSKCYKSVSPFQDVFAFDGIIQFFKGVKGNDISTYDSFPGIGWGDTGGYFFKSRTESALVEEFFGRNSPSNLLYNEIRDVWLRFTSEISYYLVVGALYNENNVPSEMAAHLELGQELVGLFSSAGATSGETRYIKSAVKEVMTRRNRAIGSKYVSTLKARLDINRNKENRTTAQQGTLTRSDSISSQGMESEVVQNAINGHNEGGERDPKVLRVKREVIESIFDGEYENIAKIHAESVFLEITGKIREIAGEISPSMTDPFNEESRLMQAIFGDTNPTENYSEEYSEKLDEAIDNDEILDKDNHVLLNIEGEGDRNVLNFTKEFDRLFLRYLDRHKDRLCEEMGAPSAPSRRLLEYFLHHGRIHAYSTQVQTDFTTMDDTRFYLLDSLGGLLED